MWVWRAGADGGVGPEYGSGCNSFLAPSAFNASPERTPPLQQVRTFGLSNGGSVLTGFDQSACGEGAGYVQGCDAYYVHDDLSAGPVGSGVVQADTLGDQSSLVWLERTGTTGTLYRAPLQQPWVPAQLASGLALPASYLPGERAFYVNETGTHVFLRDAQGLKAFPSAGGAPANLLPGAVIARQFIARAALMLPKRHLLVHTYAGSGAPCSTALCGVSRVLLDTRAVVDLGTGNGNESTSYAGPSVVSDAKVWAGCPGGPCRVITWKASPTSAEVPLAIGRLWPDLSTQYVLFTGQRPMLETGLAGEVVRSLTP
jgi:hypothetical protein